MSEKLYTTKEVANILYVQEENVRRWLKTGKVSTIRLPNGKYRITESALQSILKTEKVS